MIRWTCPTCGAKLGVPDDRAGKIGKCPKCNERLRVPVSPPAQGTPVPEPAATPEPSPPPTNDPAPIAAEQVISLVTIRGKPKWVIATVAAGLLTALVPYLLHTSSTVQADKSPSAVSADRATIKPAGLGVSLADIEAKFSAENGWYWLRKERAEIGDGVAYTAGNTNVAGAAICIEGDPANLRRFMGSMTIMRGQGISKETCKLAYILPMTMMSEVTHFPKEVKDFYQTACKESIDRHLDKDYTTHCTLPDGSACQAAFLWSDDRVIMGLAIEAR
jgi:hypothetical protein